MANYPQLIAVTPSYLEHWSDLTISEMYSITKSSSKSTDSVYGFLSSPNPNIMQRTET